MKKYTRSHGVIIAEGITIEKEETAKRMLAANMSIPQIAQFTGLKIEEIENLK